MHAHFFSNFFLGGPKMKTNSIRTGFLSSFISKAITFQRRCLVYLVLHSKCIRESCVSSLKSKQTFAPSTRRLNLNYPALLLSREFLAPLHGADSAYRPLNLVKQRRQWLVLRWVTGREHHTSTPVWSFF